MRTAPPEDLRRLLALGLLGLLVFAAGLGLAHHNLPEWQTLPMPAPESFVDKYREMTGTISFQPAADGRDTIRTALVTQILGTGLVCAERGAGDPVTAESYGACAEVRQEGLLPGASRPYELSIFFAADGTPRAAAWLRDQAWINSATAAPGAPQEQLEALKGLLVAPGERLGKPRQTVVTGSSGGLYDLIGSSPREHLQVISSPGGGILARRLHGTVAEGIEQLKRPWERIAQTILLFLFMLAVVVNFFVLVGKRHVDMVNGGILAAVFLVTLVPELFLHEPTAISVLATSLWMLVKSAWVFLVWSVGESFLRSYRPNFTTSLDSLRAGRIGPRGARALLYGLAFGAVLAGLRLWLLGLGTLSQETWPRAASLSLPLASVWESSVGQSFVMAGTVMLALAVTLRILPARLAFAGAAVAAALFWPAPLSLDNFWIEMVARVLLSGVLVAVLVGFGLTALLTATVTFFLLPAAVYSGLNLDWVPVAFAGSAGTLATILGLGLIGLRRPESIEAQRLQPPAFMRRIEEDRRLRYEMGLLARMQEGLLPPVPEVPGWQIAARSLLATEAGGDLYDFLFDEEGHLWVAVGDVAGHGYSCAIVQAMTTAALTSVIRPGMKPSEVLLHVDRVIRRGGSARNFASLTLMRLDPRSGEVVLSNAGHPFPLHILDEDVAEIVLPGLPLGKGPARHYLDVTLRLPSGSALVFCSDGLMETHDWQQTSYGFDRPLEVLRGATGATAEEILEHLLADWRRHLGSEEPPDDTTIVVVKRAG
jgi:serine phosphatase RsbU (regulator of sigma subunit)